MTERKAAFSFSGEDLNISLSLYDLGFLVEKDKIIALGLIAAFVFLFVALVGVISVTGFVVFFMGSEDKAPEQAAAPPADDTPIIDKVDSGDDEKDSGSGTTPPEDPAPKADPNPAPAPVCGDGKKADTEQCEATSDCAPDQVCNACKCDPKPEPTATKLESIQVQGITFFCPSDFRGKKGLGVKIINLKNTGSSNFSYSNSLTLKSEIGSTSDSVQTKNAYKFTVNAGKLIDIYPKDIARDDAPFLFVGNAPGQLKITIWFGSDRYVEYAYDLKATDFAKAGCL